MESEGLKASNFISAVTRREEALDGSLLDEENLRRWVEVNVELFEAGLYRDA